MPNDPYGIIERLAPSLNNLLGNDHATVRFWLCSDALVWSDEPPLKILDDDTDAMLQYLLRYRSSLVEGTPLSALQPYWEAAKKAFPKWPGFAEGRCQSSESHKAMLIELRRQANERLDESFGDDEGSE